MKKGAQNPWHVLGDRLIPVMRSFESISWDFTNVNPHEKFNSRLKITRLGVLVFPKGCVGCANPILEVEILPHVHWASDPGGKWLVMGGGNLSQPLTQGR